MFCVNTHIKDHAKGFSLVEVMVGMTVGLLSMLVIMQTFTLYENQKRTTTAGSDAQGNGLMALVNLEQQIRAAGAGFANSSAFTCATTYAWNDTSGPLAVAFSPVKITDGGATGSDTITIQTASNFLGSIPASITVTMPSSSSELNVSRTTGFTTNDLVLVSNGSGNCTLMQITQVQPAALKLQHNPGGSPSYNPSTSYQSSNGWPAYATGDTILDIGQMSNSTFSINIKNNLQDQVSLLSAAASIPSTQELVTDIVSVQAQYGVAPATPVGSQNVTAWVDAAGPWAAPSSADIKRIKAVRVILVARSAKKEATIVTQTCTNISGIVNNGPCSVDSVAAPAPKIDLSYYPNGSANPDWQKYRYRVYQTIIPLRNVIWANL